MYWTLFQLIGDDVKIEFEADDDVPKREKHVFLILFFVSAIFCFGLFSVLF